MDPLSITASAIAIIGACRKLAAGFKLLQELSRAPDEILALTDELNDLQTTLAALSLCARKRRDRFLEELLSPSFRKVDRILLELCELCGACSRRLKEEENYGEQLKAQMLVRFKWTRAKRRVGELQARLKTIRLEFANQVAAVSLLDVSHLTSEFKSLGTDILSRLPESWSTDLPEYQLLDPRSMKIPFGPEKEAARAVQTHHDLKYPQSRPDQIVKTLSGLQSPASCMRACSCICHSVYRLKSPLLLQNILGSLVVKSNGLYGLNQPCTEVFCRRNTSANVRISYRFPDWLLNRLISVIIITNRLSGPQLSLVAPRVIPNTSEIFFHAFAGNIDGIVRLFELGLASPCDVSGKWGYTPLHYAVDKGHLQLCRFLLEAGSRPEITDFDGNSVNDLAWNRVCSRKTAPAEAAELESLFKKDDWFEERQFSVLHKTVLGLLPTIRDLNLELQTSTKEIDLADSEGRTPLSWAAECGHISALKCLLKYGANRSSKSITGMTPLHYATKAPTPAGISILLEQGACVNAHNNWKQSPLNIAAYFQDDPAYLSALFKYGADINERDHYGSCPLSCATFMNNVKSASYLISKGADINIQDHIGITVMNDSIENNSHDCTALLLKSGADLAIADNDGETALHILARRADRRMLELFLASDLQDLNPEARNLAGLAAWDLMKQRVDVTEDVKLAFRSLTTKLTPHPECVPFFDAVEVLPPPEWKSSDVVEVKIQEVFVN